MNTRTGKRQNSPLISIILCTYNRAHLVTRAIASVLAQSYHHWELIIIDDGSVDDTALIVMPIVKSDPRITYCYHANQGLAQSRNIRIALARGTYTTFLDSDDEYQPDHLSVRLTAMESSPAHSLIHGGIDYVGPVDKQYVPDALHPGKKIHLPECYAGGTFFARTSVFRKLRGFRNLSFAMDLDFIQRMHKAGLKIAAAEEPTYRYRLDADHRLCDLYERGGEEAILKFREQRGGINRMKRRPSFKNLPKIQAKRFKKLRLEKERERVKRMRVRPIKKRSSRSGG
jgi:glycosyltransferase involved in cell wall biosynthesis